ncbi:MAG: 50S ribosomal protein L29 [Bacteroidia bacterium]|nr:50S ribosomal protein L29 [Bacteroidia bacterium]MBT8230353.1 50S ribosomal protein L29 [Bacteroidia bacterium]NNK89012.1 50S ribosomal protein L29 [Saprospiraceae bacterium]
MPSKKYIELQEFTDDELKNELKETETQYRKLQFDHTLRGLENPLALREVRRDIARLNTEARRRELKDMTGDQLALRTKKIARRRKK